MSTYSFMHILRKGMSIPALLLSGVLIVLQLLLPSSAFAVSASNGSFSFGHAEALDRASVSIVRLVVTYSAANTLTNQRVECSGLGVLVSSVPISNTNKTKNLILTDYNLINPSAATCAAASSSTVQFTTPEVQIYASAAYTSDPLNAPALATITLSSTDVLCQKTPCSGSALFSFTSDSLQPYLDIAVTPSAQQIDIELTDGTPTLPPQQNVILANPTLYLTPTEIQSTTSNSPSGNMPVPELGMPFVNNNGDLIGVHLMNSADSLSTTDLMRFVNSHISGGSALGNDLHTSWNSGVTNYYSLHNYSQAQTDFQRAASFNPSFKAAGVFASLALTKANETGLKQGTIGTNATPSFYGIPLSWIIVAVLIVGFLLLLLIFFLVNVKFGRARVQRREELARFKADQAEAQRISDLEVKRQQQAQKEQAVPARQIETPEANTLVDQQLAEHELKCPNCGQIVYPEDNYCPNCRFHLPTAISDNQVKAGTPVTPPVVEPPIEVAPSVPPLPQHDTYPLVGAIPSSSISDLPTMELSPSKPKNGQQEMAGLYSPVERFQGRNLSLAVGHRSDAGIKRKHKPNEDSLFAMQGVKTHDSQQQLFGLFVVADGMGGHASGQDASRLAIQTIIDFVLPKVYAIETSDDDGFLKLLVEGVQCANQAVHQRNLDEHADMGTTMTAAMVIGPNAYVANVGDSRTYMYREPEGLRKITHDHSVVASLVDAGIIKPDDVYTHPKRNQIYRSLGEKPYVEVDAFVVPLQPNDKLLLCSDGLWDMVRDPEIQRLMSSPVPDPSKTGNALIQAALEGGGEDNVSVIVVDITETTERIGITGVQLLAKPETVTVPDMPEA